MYKPPGKKRKKCINYVKSADQQIASLTKAKQSKTRPIKASELNASQSIASELKTRLSKSQSDKNQSVNCQ